MGIPKRELRGAGTSHPGKGLVIYAGATNHALTVTMHRIAIEDRKIGTGIEHAQRNTSSG